MDVEIRPYSPKDALEIRPDFPDWAAKFNQTTGLSFTGFSESKPVACGGVHCIGVAEAWFLCGEFAKKHPIELLRFCRLYLDKCIRDAHLWNVFVAGCPPGDPDRDDTTKIVSEAFLEHLGFKKVEGYVLDIGKLRT